MRHKRGWRESGASKVVSWSTESAIKGDISAVPFNIAVIIAVIALRVPLSSMPAKMHDMSIEPAMPAK